MCSFNVTEEKHLKIIRSIYIMKKKLLVILLCITLQFSLAVNKRQGSVLCLDKIL